VTSGNLISDLMELPHDTFTISSEQDAIRVRSPYVNCLFRNLTEEDFTIVYTKCLDLLRLDFSPVQVNGNTYEWPEKDREALRQRIITDSIYFYTVNGLPLDIQPSDLSHSKAVDVVLSLLDKKYGKDSEVSLALGAGVLRMEPDDHRDTVAGRRRYYER